MLVVYIAGCIYRWLYISLVVYIVGCIYRWLYISLVVVYIVGGCIYHWLYISLVVYIVGGCIYRWLYISLVVVYIAYFEFIYNKHEEVHSKTKIVITIIINIIKLPLFLSSELEFFDLFFDFC